MDSKRHSFALHREALFAPWYLALNPIQPGLCVPEPERGVGGGEGGGGLGELYTLFKVIEATSMRIEDT